MVGAASTCDRLARHQKVVGAEPARVAFTPPRPHQGLAANHRRASAITWAALVQASHGEMATVVSSLADTMWPSSPGMNATSLTESLCTRESMTVRPEATSRT